MRIIIDVPDSIMDRDKRVGAIISAAEQANAEVRVLTTPAKVTPYQEHIVQDSADSLVRRVDGTDRAAQQEQRP